MCSAVVDLLERVTQSNEWMCSAVVDLLERVTQSNEWMFLDVNLLKHAKEEGVELHPGGAQVCLVLHLPKHLTHDSCGRTCKGRNNITSIMCRINNKQISYTMHVEGPVKDITITCELCAGSILISNPSFFLCLNTSFVFMNYKLRQCNASYSRAFIVDWSLSGIMTSKLVILEYESPRPAASSILISRMTSSSVIIPYENDEQNLIRSHSFLHCKQNQTGK